MIAIVILNWNGADDTLACLESLSHVEEPHFVVIADNNSTNDSVERIQYWLDQHSDNDNVRQYQLLQLDANYGFAVGNNKALAVAMQRNPDYCLLLNNDTEVKPDFLTHLADYVRHRPEVKILSPCICYYSDKEKVWFSGGKLSFGVRKNLYANKAVDSVEKHPFSISFISGCALFFETSLLNEHYELFNNDFFFGEEDDEVSLRMTKQCVPMVCVPQSLVYHKVGASQKNTKDARGLGRAYMYYHNRLVCNRMHEGRAKFFLIWILTGFTSLRYFVDYSGSWKIGLKIVAHLLKKTRVSRAVDSKDFQALMFDNTYFPFAVK